MLSREKEILMNKHAIYHRPESNYCFATSSNTVVLRIRFAKGEKVRNLSVLYNSKYDIAEHQFRATMSFLCCDGTYDYYFVEINLKDPRLAYVFEFSLRGQKYYFCESGVREKYNFSLAYYDSFQFAYINKNDIIQNVKWLNNAVFYQVFIDRFDKASQKDEAYINTRWNERPTPKSFYGGDLDGIRKHIDHIKKLGVTALYLNPIFKSPSNHKYDIVDYYKVDEMFGGEDALARLVDECHKNGIRIILDAVFNHVSEEFGPFVDVINNGNKSKYFDWFVIDGDEINKARDNYHCFAECRYMPKLNTNNKEVQAYLSNVAKYYIEKYDIDGWRLDVADEVSHDFWRTMRKEIKAIKHDAVLIGENWHNSESFLQGDQFDSIMNYGVTKAFIDYFARRTITEKEFADVLNAQLMRYPDTINNMMFNLLDCHDTNRFFSEVGCNEEVLLSALTALVFLPGSINLYYGTEILTEGGYDPDSRRTFDFEKLKDPRIIKNIEAVSRIMRLKQQPALISGGIRIYSNNGCICFERKCSNQQLILRLNSKSYSIEGELL